MRRALGLSLIAVLLAACSSRVTTAPASTADPGLAVPADAGTAVVERVVDGDTVVARVDGRHLRVRLVGIDTPESVKPNTAVACFGHEAAALTRNLSTGRTIRYAYEIEHQDSYGRELWDIWLPDGRWLQGVLVASGVARAYPFRPNTLHAQQLTDLMARAHDARLGLWSHCSLTGAFPQLAPRQ